MAAGRNKEEMMPFQNLLNELMIHNISKNNYQVHSLEFVLLLY